MIEVNKTYDLLPNIDLQAYRESSKKWISKIMQKPGFVELRAQRNVLSSPLVRTTFLWKTLADWAKFAESPDREALESELRKFATNIRIEIWAPSSIVPEPLRPK